MRVCCAPYNFLKQPPRKCFTDTYVSLTSDRGDKVFDEFKIGEEKSDILDFVMTS